MRVLVCGGRDFKDEDWLYRILDNMNKNKELGPITTIIHGDADGADFYADLWAKRNEIRRYIFPAQWGLHDKAAGPIRNQEMLEEGYPAYAVAFPGGKGTADMVRRLKDRRITVFEMQEPPEDLA